MIVCLVSISICCCENKIQMFSEKVIIVAKGPSYSKTYFFLRFLGRGKRQVLLSSPPPQRAQNYNEKNLAKKPSHGKKGSEKAAKRRPCK